MRAIKTPHFFLRAAVACFKHRTQHFGISLNYMHSCRWSSSSCVHFPQLWILLFYRTCLIVHLQLKQLRCNSTQRCFSKTNSNLLKDDPKSLCLQSTFSGFGYTPTEIKISVLSLLRKCVVEMRRKKKREKRKKNNAWKHSQDMRNCFY